MGRRRADQRGAVAIHVVAALVAFVLAAVAVVFVATRHTARTENGQTGASTPPPTAVTNGAIGLSAPPAPSMVLEPAATGESASRGAVQAALGALVASPKLGHHVAVEVAALGSDRPVYRNGASPLVTPASTMKLLTTTAVLSALGPEHRFTTSVVAGKGAQIIVVGGGDPLLTDKRPNPASAGYPVPASLADLATQTAKAVRSNGTARVRLGYDDSLFDGPAVNPAWEPSYLPESIVSPITALWVDEGRLNPLYAQRAADPSAEAARRFAALLAARGIKVIGPPSHVVAPKGATELAAVDSAPLAEIVQHVLEQSDNEGAEVLLRQVAVAAGGPTTTKAASALVVDTLSSLGVDLGPGAVIDDGSGLARSDRVPVGALVDVLQLAASPDHPDLRSVVAGLPVAGFSGTLDYRFVGVAPDGLGLVRAKTGTLRGVHAFAGLAQGPSGVLVFAAVADDVPVRRTLDARAQLDRIGAALARCC